MSLNIVDIAKEFKKLINPQILQNFDETNDRLYYTINGLTAVIYLEKMETIFQAVITAMEEKIEGHTMLFKYIPEINRDFPNYTFIEKWKVTTRDIKCPNYYGDIDTGEFFELTEVSPVGSDYIQLAFTKYLNLTSIMFDLLTKLTNKNTDLSKSKEADFKWHSIEKSKVIIYDEDVKEIVEDLNKKYTINLKSRDLVDFFYNKPNKTGPKIIWRTKVHGDSFVKYLRYGLGQKGGDYKKNISNYFELPGGKRFEMDSSGLNIDKFEEKYKELHSICIKILKLIKPGKS